MGEGEYPECRPSTEEEEEEEEEPQLLWAAKESLSGIRLAEAPILLLAYFHKAFHAELAELRHGAAALTEMGPRGHRECLRELRGRFEFLMLAHEYHSAAQDEVIFPALDSHVQNVVCTYSLEHRSIGELFNSTIRFFDLLMEDGDNEPEPYRELAVSLSTVQSSFCNHMRKEEMQVFRLLMQRFSRKEQASFVWQFLCSVPAMLLENLFPWMISFISPDEQEQIIDFVKDTVPEESLLQEVMIGWIRKKDWSYLTGNMEIRPMRELDGRSASGESTLEQQQQASVGKIPKFSLTDGFKIWHGAIRIDFETALEALHLLKSSGKFSNLPAVLLQLKFLLDAVVLYSNALHQIYYHELNELADGHEFSSFDWFVYERQIGRLQQLLRIDAQDEMLRCDFIEQLSRELKSFLMEIHRFFSYQETEVLNVISVNCSHEMQMQLLYTSICTLPLGWIECLITWFAARLSAEESRSILVNINRGDNTVGRSFTLLLHQWFRVACSGKKSIDESRTDPRYLFKTTLFALPEHFKGEAKFSASTSQLNNEPCRRSYPRLLGADSAAIIKLNTSHSGRIALSSFFSLRPKASNNSKSSAVKNDVISNMDRWEPVDIILFFHKVMEKDLTNLVQKSLKLMEDASFLEDFRKRFVLICSLYQIHSDTEDEVAFPALEGKGRVQNISFSYTIDHRLQAEHIDDISSVLDKISKLHISSNDSDLRVRQRHHHLCLRLQDMCRSMHRIVSDHIRNEEIEIWASVRECLSVAEQEKVIGCMLGRIRAEVLQDMIPWLMESLTPEEGQMLMSTWRHVTRNTMFDEWLQEWWEGDNVEKEGEVDISPSKTADPLEIISSYLSKDIHEEHGEKICNQVVDLPQGRATISKSKQLKMSAADEGNLNRHKSDVEYSKCTELSNGAAEHLQVSCKSEDQENVSVMSQEELETAIRRVSRDSSLDLQQKSSIIQSLLMSRWIATHQKSDSAVTVSKDGEEIPGRSPSYHDQFKMTYGCKHYKRNCKLLTACCNQLYSCRHCHDEENDHLVDRKSITKMMCMKCLTIQPIGTVCSAASCDNLVMAKYYCRICSIYEDEREIYHCPYCNLCRVGKGLGINYFHCMNCNACMSRALSVHKCRQKCLEENCPICHEYIFTSYDPAKALPCGHFMHSACFREYTRTHYTCPICSKSLGDMQVYFQLLDTLLAEEQMPDEYSGKTQAILCNDCEKRGSTTFHWFYHKCVHCGSYNTRLL